MWPAPAAAFAAPRVQGLVYVGADEPRSDLVSAGLSAFGHEVHRVVQVAQSVPTPRLWLLDEFGRGTHPEEGAALGQALLRKLEARMDFVLASTHFTALAKLPDVDLWRVRGLRDAPSMPPDMDLTAALRANMDYRVEPARGDREIPRDAFTIAAWLNFDLI